MSSILNNNSLIINSTQEITGISTAVNEGNYNEIPTAKAIYDLLASLVPVSLTVSGDWSNPQYTNTAVDTTGLSFTATFLDGSGKSVTPTVSPSTWSSTVGTQTATFSYTENGVTVSASKSASVVVPHNWSAWKKIGGVIFYINTSGTGSYEFKNAGGTAVSAPTVGTDCTNWTYRYDLNDYNVDRFYVYYPTLVASKHWGYYNITTSAAGTGIGDGKTNSSTVLAKTDTSSYASGSIWEYIRNMRTNNTNGCDDWFVGCPAEYDQLRSSGTTGAGWFSSYNICSSREYSSTGVYYWYYKGSRWATTGKLTSSALVPVRAF